MQQRHLVMQQRFVVRRRQRLRWWLWRVWRIMIMPDRFGLGWRHKLALGILSHLDRIDIVEVIADDYFRAPHRERRALRTPCCADADHVTRRNTWSRFGGCS